MTEWRRAQYVVVVVVVLVVVVVVLCGTWAEWWRDANCAWLMSVDWLFCCQCPKSIARHAKSYLFSWNSSHLLLRSLLIPPFINSSIVLMLIIGIASLIMSQKSNSNLIGHRVSRSQPSPSLNSSEHLRREGRSRRSIRFLDLPTSCNRSINSVPELCALRITGVTIH